MYDYTLEIKVAKGERLSPVKCGKIRLHLNNCVKIISNDYYVPKFSVNLLSVNELTRKGFQVSSFSVKQCKDLNERKVKATAMYMNGVYQLDT